MTGHGGFKNKTNAKKYAKGKRKKGFICTIYKMKKGYGVSVTTKK